MQPVGSYDARGFLRSLFDLSFHSLVTTKIIRFVYVLIVAFLSLGAVVLFIGGLVTRSVGGILFALIAVPLGYLIYLTLARIWMELLIVVFRIGEDLRAIRLGGGGLAPPAPPTAPMGPVGPGGPPLI